MGRMTQCDMILDHLKRHKDITTMDAFMMYGVTRLSARIWDLRHDGYNISSEQTTQKNRYGVKVTFATYRLEA
jgi:hypothetical protein